MEGRGKRFLQVSRGGVAGWGCCGGAGGGGVGPAWAAESFASFRQRDVRHFPALNGKELSMHPQHTHTLASYADSYPKQAHIYTNIGVTHVHKMT